MNPWDLTASELMLWGLVVHLIADWPLQNDWMANNKAARVEWSDRWGHWWAPHPAAFVHAGIHGVLLAFVFGWVAVPLAVAHGVIDRRWPVAWWSRAMRQTQPQMTNVVTWENPRPLMAYDVGLEVRFWTDQVFHIACIAVAALVVA